MTFEDFTDLVVELTQIRWKDILKKNKFMMIKKPVAE